MKFSELFDSSELPQIKGSEADTILKLFHAGIAPSGQTEQAFFRALGLHSAQNDMASASQLGMFNNFRMMVSPDAVRLAERQENARAAYDLLTKMSLQGELRGPVNPATIGPPPQQLANPNEQFSMSGGGGGGFGLPGMTGPMGPSGPMINSMTNQPTGQAPAMPGPGVSLVPQPGIVGTYGGQPIDAAQRAFLLDPRAGLTMKEQTGLQIPTPSVYERVAGAQLRTQERLEAARERQQEAQGFTAEQKGLDRDLRKSQLEEQKHRNEMLRVQRDQMETDRQERLTRQAFNSDRRSLVGIVGLAPFLLQDAQGNMMGINPAAYQTHATNIEQYVQKAQQRADQSRRAGKTALTALWQQEADLYRRAPTMPDPETPAGKYNLYRQQGMSKEDAAKKAGVTLKK